jgi:hypothetical protein
MKVWITKYALTKGIKSIDATPSSFYDGVCDNTNGTGAYSTYYHGEGRDWHRTLEGAQAKAEKMRLAKIELLEKQIGKLRNLKF